MQRKLKQVVYSTDKPIHTNLWLFQPSLYEVIIIYPMKIFPYIRISTESAIQICQLIEHPSINVYFLIVVTKAGSWIAYEINVQGNQLKVHQNSKSTLLNVQQKVVGLHLLTEELMVVFVKERGQLEYNFIQFNGEQKNNYKTFMINKSYCVQTSNQKYKKSSLYSSYQGRDLLQIKNQTKILQSVTNFLTKQLFVLTEDINSKVCSINKFFLQDYEIIMGADVLLNLPCKPLQMLLWSSVLLVNFGTTVLLWCRNITQSIQLPEIGGTCYALKQVNKQTYLITIIKDNDTYVYSMQINPTPKDSNKIANIKFQNLKHIKHTELILYYNPVQQTKSIPAISISSKLQLIEWVADNTPRTILSNMHTTILSAKLHKLTHSNYLQVAKKIGHTTEYKVITNNRIVTAMQEYQHNMLIKMANVIHYRCWNGAAEVYVSSPIIGTLKLIIDIDGNNNVTINTGTKQPNINNQQQSIYIATTPQNQLQQLTPTAITTNRYKLTVSQLFDSHTEMVLGGCLLGSYVVLGVQRQVHVYGLEPKPKRMHITCFDTEINAIVSVNRVNLYAVVLWDGSLRVMRIGDRECVTVYEVAQLGGSYSNNYFNFDVNINTSAHCINIIGNYMLIASNDPLHIYQPQKTTLNATQLDRNKFGQHFHKVVDLSPQKNQQKHQILSNVQSRWMLVTIPTKLLVKNIEDVKLEVEEIIAFPYVEDILICAVRDNYVFVLTASRIVTCAMQTGSITYSVQFTLSMQKNINYCDSVDYLRRWLNKQTVSYQSYQIQQARSDMNITHPNIIKLNQNRILLYNEKQIWYASLNKKQIKLISYFSMQNNAFLEFRNNLGVQELENLQFMDMFAEKLPICSVAAISDTLIAVLYSKIIVLVQINTNGGIVIRQQLPFSQCPGLISITQFVGVYDQMSIYLKDQSHRLVLLKYNSVTKKYFLQIQDQLDDEIVCIHRLKGWYDRTKKLSIYNNEQTSNFQEMIVRKDGQMIVGNDGKQLYI